MQQRGLCYPPAHPTETPFHFIGLFGKGDPSPLLLRQRRKGLFEKEEEEEG